MKIKMRTKSAGPEGVMLPGQVYDVSEAEGKALCNGRYAEEVKEAPAAAAAPAAEPEQTQPEADKPPETAAAPAAPEAATVPHNRQEKPAGHRRK